MFLFYNLTLLFSFLFVSFCLVLFVCFLVSLYKHKQKHTLSHTHNKTMEKFVHFVFQFIKRSALLLNFLDPDSVINLQEGIAKPLPYALLKGYGGDSISHSLSLLGSPQLFKRFILHLHGFRQTVDVKPDIILVDESRAVKLDKGGREDR